MWVWCGAEKRESLYMKEGDDGCYILVFLNLQPSLNRTRIFVAGNANTRNIATRWRAIGKLITLIQLFTIFNDQKCYIPK